MFKYQGSFTNAETFRETFYLRDLEEGADPSAWSWEFVLSDRSGSLIAEATCSVDTSGEEPVLLVTIPLSTMETLDAEHYEVGCRYTDEDGVTVQTAYGRLSLIEGNFPS